MKPLPKGKTANLGVIFWKETHSCLRATSLWVVGEKSHMRRFDQSDAVRFSVCAHTQLLLQRAAERFPLQLVGLIARHNAVRSLRQLHSRHVQPPAP